MRKWRAKQKKGPASQLEELNTLIDNTCQSLVGAFLASQSPWQLRRGDSKEKEQQEHQQEREQRLKEIIKLAMPAVNNTETITHDEWNNFMDRVYQLFSEVTTHRDVKTRKESTHHSAQHGASAHEIKQLQEMIANIVSTINKHAESLNSYSKEESKRFKAYLMKYVQDWPDMLGSQPIESRP